MWRISALAVALLALFIPIASGVVLHTSSRWIVNESNKRVKLRCVNWAGHMETNIPEGLQHQPVSSIGNFISRAGFNCVRLTYSIDMALNPNQLVSASFSAAASPAGVTSDVMQSLYDSVVGKNPWIASTTTRGTFARVIQELGKVGVMVILDNHVSKAGWCCSNSDGNGWWASASGYDSNNSRYFDTNEWLKGLRDMASFSARHANVVGMSLRNELRPVGSQDMDNHADWYTYVTQGAQAIHYSNRDLLIVVGGLDYATNLSHLYSSPLDRTAYPNKIVWEFHNYAWTFGSGAASNCTNYQSQLGSRSGFLLTQGKAFTGPLWLSEFGWAQTGTTADQSQYVDCLVNYMEGNDADWAYWALQGDYYVRKGLVNNDESWGLLQADWSGWRNATFSARLGKLWQVTQGPLR